MIDRICDMTKKFNYFNAAGGLVINREADRMLNGVKTFKDDCWFAFTFFMALFSQVFSPSNKLFSNEFISMIERNPCTKENVSYEKKFDVCSDGNMRSTISYVTSRFDRFSNAGDDGRMHLVYDSVLDSFGIDFSSNSNGYCPKSSKKVLFEEHAVYSKRVCKETYEDRGFKHLYKRHHSCSSKSSCKFCNGVICERGKSSKRSVNYKEDDLFQLENEEISCDNMFVDYSKVKEFYDERNETDVKMKGDSFTTLIPPPLSNAHRKERGVRVFVTEINADFCCNDITPLTVHDPVWVEYDVDCHQVR